MANNKILTVAIQLINSGKKDSARSLLEPYLRENPNDVGAWIWEAEIFENDGDKIRVLEACLKFNPGRPEILQALSILNERVGRSPSLPVETSQPAPRQSTAAPAFVPPFHMDADFADEISFSIPPSKPALDDAGQPPAPAADLPGMAKPSKSNPPVPDETFVKEKPPRAGRMNAAIAVGALVVLLFSFGTYLGGGFYLNNQVGAAYAEKNCAKAVQYESLPSFYPTGLFASIFAGLAQYSECAAVLNIEQALAAENWEDAAYRIQEYGATYPNGAFAEEMKAQGPSALSAWADELIAARNYGGAIEKLIQIVKTYPDSSYASSAPDDILENYLAWSRELIENQNFDEAEQHLKTAWSYFENDAARAEPVKSELVALYISWGGEQVKTGDAENGIAHYRQAAEISPGSVDVDLMAARVELQDALDAAERGDFDRALRMTDGVGAAAQADNVKAEANSTREEVFDAYSASTSQQALDQMTAAILSTCQGQLPSLPIFARNPESIRFGLIAFGAELPSGWAAESPGDLHYVLCVTEGEREIESCPYAGGHYLVRLRYVWQISLVDILTGKDLDSETFTGPAPEECKSKEYFSRSMTTRKAYGGRPAAEEIIAWLSEWNLGR